MAHDLQNKVVIVTGGGSGIGRELCRLFSSQGARVIIADINVAGAEETLALLENPNLGTAVELDVTSEQSWLEFREQVRAHHGRIDVLCNNAGITRLGNVGEFSLDEYHLQNKINIDGVVLGCHTFAKDFKQQGRGHIVNTASLAGLVATAYTSTYSATKFAVVGFSTALAQEMAEHGVRVGILCPGVVDTPMNDSLDYPGDEESEAMSPHEVAGRVIDAVLTKDERLFIFTDPGYADVVEEVLAVPVNEYKAFTERA